MAQANNTLSPSLFAVILEQIAAGHLRPASVLSNVQSDLPITYGNASARFVKERPGHFVISLYRDGQEVGQEQASSPVEAKLLVLDYVVSEVRKQQKAS